MNSKLHNLQSLLDNAINLESETSSVHLQLATIFKFNPDVNRVLQAQYQKGLNEYGMTLNINSPIDENTMELEALHELVDALCYTVTAYKKTPSPKLLIAIGHIIDAIFSIA
jgi:hypothetical protein